ncbi:MAG: hypothetical protein ACPGWR_17130 [Ardenticatenaceae bacterium]
MAYLFEPSGTAEVVEAIDEVNDLIYSVAAEKVIIFDGSSLSVDHKPLMRQSYGRDFLHLNQAADGVLNRNLGRDLALVRAMIGL